MQLATGLTANGVAFGPIVDGDMCDVSVDGPWTCLAEALGDDQRHLLERVAKRSPRIAVSDLVWLPPIPAPRRILCVGLNYSEHAAESDQGRVAASEFPVIFTRFGSSIVGHGSPLVRPLASTAFDYEGELAVVIGATMRAVPAENALQGVAGYSCFMDGTLRDFQRHTSQFIPGKNFDRSGSFGPWIVTRDDFDHDAAVLTTRVNGETLQRARIAEMIHPIAGLIAYCSTFTTLDPGDVIATGTPGGVGYARRPQRWLAPGDEVEVEVVGVGTLRNAVASEESVHAVDGGRCAGSPGKS